MASKNSPGLPPHVIRKATPLDIAAIVAIYNHEVLTSTATFDTTPISVESFLAARASYDARTRPLLVAASDAHVMAWASLSDWSSRCAYARAAEVSVYIGEEYRGQGLGAQLMAALIAEAKAAGVGTLLSRISLGEPPASVRLHERFGFAHVGTLRRVGEKFGRVLDVEIMQLGVE